MDRGAPLSVGDSPAPRPSRNFGGKPDFEDLKFDFEKDGEDPLPARVRIPIIYIDLMSAKNSESSRFRTPVSGQNFRLAETLIRE